MLSSMKQMPVIKIAVLVTGCSPLTPHLRKHPKDMERIIWRDFLDQQQNMVDEDDMNPSFGHGSLIVSLLLKVLPKAKLYVGRVARNRHRQVEVGLGQRMVEVTPP